MRYQKHNESEITKITDITTIKNAYATIITRRSERDRKAAEILIESKTSLVI